MNKINFQNLSLRSSKIFILILFILLIILFIIGVLLRESTSPVAPDPKSPTSTTEIKSSNFYDQVVIPSNYSSSDNLVNHGTDFSEYLQTIVSPNNNLKLSFDVIPTSSKNKLNTGAGNYIIPQDLFLNNMFQITTFEGQSLYREDATTMYLAAKSDSVHQYLNSRDLVTFQVYYKTGNDIIPYKSIIKTSHNDEVSINGQIPISLNKSDFDQAVSDFDTIIKSLKI